MALQKRSNTYVIIQVVEKFMVKLHTCELTYVGTLGRDPLFVIGFSVGSGSLDLTSYKDIFVLTQEKRDLFVKSVQNVLCVVTI